MRFGIAFRLGLLLAFIGVVAAGLTGFYAYDVSQKLLVEAAKRELLTSTQVLARRIVLTRDDISRNLQILTKDPATLSVLHMPDARQADQLATLFTLLMQANPSYFQVRLISADDYGIEVVRVDRDDNRLVRVTGDELQEKGQYAYVFDTLKLPAGKAYMSSIAINHERGAHSSLDQPTVQLAMPVVDEAGFKLGVIVISVDLNSTFGLLAKDLPKAYQLFLANGQGDYLIHPDRMQTFGFDKGRRILVQDEFSATRDLVAGKTDKVLLEASDGRYTTAPVVAAFIGRPVAIASGERRLILGLAQPLAATQTQANKLGDATLRVVLGLCLVCILLAALLAGAVTRPINSMSRLVQGFSGKEQVGGLPLERQDEIGTLARAFNHMQNQIIQQLAELRDNSRELEHLARHDTLTGLPNRALFDDRMEHALAAARRDKARLALMFIDLNKFKPINDNLGHTVGDLLLKEVADRIRHAVRESDTVARIGGDEFVVLLPNIHRDDDAGTVAEKILQAVNEPFAVEGHSITATASIGIALYPEDGSDTFVLSKRADQAMYRAKAQGGNAVVRYQTNT